MHISSIKLVNFRLFEKLELSLNPGLNILVGENDSGKTAFIDAIRYTLGTNSNERAYLSEEDFHKDCNELRIQLTFSDVKKHAHRFVEHLSHQEYTDENGRIAHRPVLHIQLKAQKTSAERRGYPYIKMEIKSGLDGNGISIESEIRDFLSATYLKPLRDAESELSSGRASRLSQILSSSKDIKLGLEEILSVVANANDQLLKDDRPLKKSAENIQDNYLHQLIFEQDKKNLGVFIDIAGIREQDLNTLPDNVKKRYLRQILEGLSLALTKDRRLHGLGYHNLLFMGAELLLLEQEAENECPLLLIEEPEAHLHPQLQMKLLQFIQSKIKISGVQCFLTTHSPNISAKVSPSDVIILNDGKGFSLRSTETELIKSDYEHLRKFLDATKANIFFAKSVLLVEGDGENILLPEIARLLGKPLENYGVSIVKYDNSGSWKRFARLFLRKGKDENPEEWNPIKICVLRDLDLWPDCAEEKEANIYGFKKRRPKNVSYWHSECSDIEQRKKDHIGGLERQNIRVKISDDWTFEYCLAKHGLFDECCTALKVKDEDKPNDDISLEEKATFILSKVNKTDFAYDMADLLEKQRSDKIEAATIEFSDEQKNDPDDEDVKKARQTACSDFALDLKEKLPPYIVDAIEHVTSPIVHTEGPEEE